MSDEPRRFNGGWPLVGVLLAVLGIVAGWSLNYLSYVRDRIDKLELRVSGVEGSRCTDADCDKIAERLANFGAELRDKADGKDVPPQSVLTTLERHEKMIRDLERLHRTP